VPPPLNGEEGARMQRRCDERRTDIVWGGGGGDKGERGKRKAGERVGVCTSPFPTRRASLCFLF